MPEKQLHAQHLAGDNCKHLKSDKFKTLRVLMATVTFFLFGFISFPL